MGVETRILHLYPWPFPRQALEAVRSAKAALDLPFLVKPQPARPGVRVLCSEPPPFAADYAIVRGDDPESWRWALEWSVTDRVDERSTSMAGWLSAQFGAEVRELAPEPLEQRVSFS